MTLISAASPFEKDEELGFDKIAPNFIINLITINDVVYNKAKLIPTVLVRPLKLRHW